jgi:hypothetical protein
MYRILLALFVAVTLAYYGWSCPHASGTGEPIDVSGELLQTPTTRHPFEIDTRKGLVTLAPRAAFDASAVVAHDEHYRMDDGAFLVPVDLVMTWGKLPEEPYQSQVSYGQMARYYFWRTPSGDLDLHYVETHSANMHMIPADENVRHALLAVGGGDRVRVQGFLVDAHRQDGFYWNSSLTREDTGPGACELVYVETIQIGRKLYR